MLICDRCREVKEYGMVAKFTFGLHRCDVACSGKNGQLNFEIDLCPDCIDYIDRTYMINNYWQNLKNKNEATFVTTDPERLKLQEILDK